MILKNSYHFGSTLRKSPFGSPFLLVTLNSSYLLMPLMVFLLLQTVGSAQFRGSLQLAAAIPVGYFEDVAEAGGGSTLNLVYYPLNVDLEFSLTTGYYSLGYKENLPGYTFRYTGIPLLAGAKFNFSSFDFIPYVGLEAGVYFDRYFVTIDYGLLGKFTTETSDINPGISPYAGFRMNLSPSLDLDVNARYNRINTKYYARAYIVIQTGLAYRFGE